MAKSNVHIELARRCLIWLDARATARGLRGCEEVILSEGYVADAAAICGLTLANEKMFLSGIEGSENIERYSQQSADDYTFVFESKVSRGDFFNTFKRGNHKGDRLSPIANFHFVVAPKGMVTPDEIPAFWGLLEKSGVGLKLSKLPVYQSHSKERLHELGYIILRSFNYWKFFYHYELIEQYRKDQESENGLFNEIPIATNQ